ncbi:MAG TPA: hypothetical protein VFF22_06655 [Pseudomonas sp.]|nr:hypothetical protein [Pseudomonas sp.]
MRAAPEFNRGEIQHVSVVEVQPEAMLMTHLKTAAKSRLYIQGCYEHKEGVEYAEGKTSAPHIPAVCEKAL